MALRHLGAPVVLCDSWLVGASLLAHLFLAVLGLCCCTGFLSLRRAGASHCRDCSCCRHWPWGTRASVVVAPGLSCSAACGIFSDQGSEPSPQHCEEES